MVWFLIGLSMGLIVANRDRIHFLTEFSFFPSRHNPDRQRFQPVVAQKLGALRERAEGESVDAIKNLAEAEKLAEHFGFTT